MKSGAPEGSVTTNQLPDQIYQGRYSAEKVQDVHPSEHVKK
jgi:hypothetical protein